MFIAFSFFRYIFLGERIQVKNRTAILNHEMVHVKQYALGEPDASTLYTFFQDIQSGTYEGAPHDPGTFFIEDDDVARSGKDSRLVVKDFDPNKDDYKDGRVYIDFITKIAYVKQGQYFVPYSEWSAEEIKTD